MAAEKKNVTVTKTDAVFVRQSDETELGALTRRIELAIGNCNRLKQRHPELLKMKAALVKLELVAHNMWAAEAQQK
jgi:hypothetical protein